MVGLRKDLAVPAGLAASLCPEPFYAASVPQHIPCYRSLGEALRVLAGGADKSLSVPVDRDAGMGAKGAHPAWQQPPGARSTPGEKLWWGRGERGSARSLLRPWKLQEFHFWGYFLKTRGVGRRQGDRGTRLVLGL